MTNARTILPLLLALSALACSSADGGYIGGPPAPANDTPPADAGSPTDDAAPPETTPPPPEEDGGAPVDSTPPPPKEPELVPVKDLSIKELAIFQGVKVPLEKDGVKLDVTEKVHVVEGREGILRVYVQPGASWTPREVVAELTLKVEGKTPKVIKATKTVSGASTESDLASTINIELETGAIETGATYKVRLLTAPGQSEGTVKAASYPEGDAFEALDVWDTGDVLKVMLVPVKANGYVPDTSPEQIERYRSELHALYPTKKVEIKVHEVWPSPVALGARGSGIYGLLDAITALRKKEAAPKDVYYYGAFTPTSSYSTYCSGGCTTGLCHLPGPNDTFLRACVGVGFTGTRSAGTMAHELGHAHGRPHAPCGGVAGADSRYPYSGGSIGAWGYDVRTKKLISPSTGKDFMSYCGPEWISDYSFDKILHRMSSVAKETPFIVGGAPQAYRMMRVMPDGTLEWGDEITLDEPLFGEPHTVSTTSASGATETVTGHFYPYADGDGGTLFVPVGKVSPKIVEVSGFAPGVQKKLTLD